MTQVPDTLMGAPCRAGEQLQLRAGGSIEDRQGRTSNTQVEPRVAGKDVGRAAFVAGSASSLSSWADPDPTIDAQP